MLKHARCQMNSETYLLPTALTRRPLPAALPVAGALRAAVVTLLHRDRPDDVVPAAALSQSFAERAALISAPREAFAGLSLDKPLVMGVINVTPDSFSDGGDRLDAERAISEGLAMARAGAAILDVGGESTRPGAEPVPIAEELRRVLPVIEALAAQGLLVSVDTRRPEVMRAAASAGARILNDVTALTGDPGSLETAAELGLPVVLMHMQGEPRSMQADPTYCDVALDVFDSLEARVAACLAAGIPRRHIAIDPGIGFGKTLAHKPPAARPSGTVSRSRLRGDVRCVAKVLHCQADAGAGSAAQAALARQPRRGACRPAAGRSDPARARRGGDLPGRGGVGGNLQD